MFDSMTECFRSYARFCEWHRDFRRRCQYSYFKELMRIAYCDKANGYKKSHPGTARTVRGVVLWALLFFVTIILGITKHNLLCWLAAIVSIVAFVLQLGKAINIVMEVDKIATEAVRIFRASQNFDTAVAAISSGKIARKFSEERKKFFEKRAKESKERFLRELLGIIADEETESSSGDSTPPPQGSSAPSSGTPRPPRL